MSAFRKVSSTNKPFPFFMASATDHISGVTGQAANITATVSLNGGAFGAALGAVTEIGNGWYQLAGNATDRAIAGTCLVHATCAGCDAFDGGFEVVPWDPFDANLALTALAGVAAAGTAGGLATVDASNRVAGVSGNVAGSVGSVVAAVTAGTVTDKTGYSIGQAFPTNFASLAITAGGAVTVGTNADKTGYALTSAEHTNIAGDVLNAAATGYNAAGSIGNKINAAGNAANPWSIDVSTGFTGTQAGALLFGNLDAKVSGRLAAASAPANFGSMAITVGGAVTVGTNSDKTGYSLAPAGLDPVVIETGVNARQALSGIFAGECGVLSGAATNTITIAGGNVATTRIQATVDADGNRSAVALSLPA